MNKSDTPRDFWARLGSLRHLMTSIQAHSALYVIGELCPAVVAVHDCGLVRIVVNDETIYVDREGRCLDTEVALKRIEIHEAKPRRGRPRKAKS